MDLTKYYPDIVAKYPAYVTKRELCEICHICPKTAYNLEQQGEIPYTIEQNHLIRSHKIKLTDILAYLYRRECRQEADGPYICAMRTFYDEHLSPYSDLLSVKDIQQITGFSSSAIVRWISTGILKAFQPGKQYTVPKDFMRLMIVAQGVRDSVQSAIVDVATENWDEAYAGLREGYSGGYQLAGSSWSQNVTSGNVYARLQDVLGIEYEGGQYVKYSGENLEYRLYDLHLDVENAPLAPSVPDGITQLNVTGTITVDVPLSFGFGHLPPMQITMKLNAKYVPRF